MSKNIITGNVNYDPSVDYSDVEEITGYLYLGSASDVSMPVLATVGGDLYLGSASDVSMPVLATVGGYLDLWRASDVSMPVLATVGGSLDLRRASAVSMPVLATVGGDLYLGGASSVSMPKNVKTGIRNTVEFVSLGEARKRVIDLQRQNSRLVARIAEVESENERLDEFRLALEGLTPGGSEYHNNIQRCVEFIQHAKKSGVRVAKKFKMRERGLEAKLKSVMDRVESMKTWDETALAKLGADGWAAACRDEADIILDILNTTETNND